MDRVAVAIQRLPHGKDLPLPAYQTAGSAGVDLYAAVDGTVNVSPGDVVRVPTGIALAIPAGYEGQVRARSGLAAKSPLILPNSPGTIDSDYRGEVQVLVRNVGDEPFAIQRGMRIAQLVVAPIARADWIERDALDGTERGSGGFGSTGA